MCSKNSKLELGNAINADKWITEHEASFVPPICNKLMYGAGQLKVMYVGGPNTRKDYHIEEGEELFYMVNGDMCLKVMEQGKPKDVIIREGEIFLLPCHIPHSPQRNENTIGWVIERKRVETEKDCLRWYCDDGTTVLFEEWFHCTNLGKDLVPVVNHFLASNEYKTGKPGGNIGKPPFELDVTTKMHQPFSLQKWLEENKEEVGVKGFKVVFQSQQTKVVIHGKGKIMEDANNETWLWQFEGNAILNCDGKEQELAKNSVILIPCDTKFSCNVLDGAYTILVTMETHK